MAVSQLSTIRIIRNNLMTIIQNIHRRFLKNENRVTKYLHLQLKLLSVLGLFKSTKSSTASSALHQFHMGFSFTFFATFLTLTYICAVTKSSKEFAEFSNIIFELIGMAMLFFQTVLLNSRRSGLIELLEKMDKFDLNSHRTIFIAVRRLERLAFFVLYGGIGFVVLLKFSVPFFPIDARSAAHVQSIYGFKYPQNRLPMCLGLPFVDTSEPSWFYVLYMLEILLWSGGSRWKISEKSSKH
uniref:Odorant receptor n=1 Tax=Cacopsylla melanoneura TaxID=428564 RepID=A0A8D8SSM8_9HEMI